MFNLKYEDIVSRIKEEKGLDEADIKSRIEKKLNMLSGFISKEGAAHILANELGIKIVDDFDNRRFKIKKLIPGMRNIELVGKVTRKFDVREFKTEKREGKVGSLVLGDETGSFRVVFWGDKTDELTKINVDDIIKIKNINIRDNRDGFKEAHTNDKTRFLINPEGEKVDVVSNNQSKDVERKKIEDLKGGEFNIQLLGTIVQLFEPRFYSSCPQCNKKVEDQNGSPSCGQHGAVTPVEVPIANLFLDDGSSNIRVVCFREQAEKLFGLNAAQVLEMKDNPGKFMDIKDNILGKQVMIEGKANKNEMFNRLEFVARNVSDISPQELLKELENA